MSARECTTQPRSATAILGLQADARQRLRAGEGAGKDAIQDERFRRAILKFARPLREYRFAQVLLTRRRERIHRGRNGFGGNAGLDQLLPLAILFLPGIDSRKFRVRNVITRILMADRVIRT